MGADEFANTYDLDDNTEFELNGRMAMVVMDISALTEVNPRRNDGST